MILCQTEREQVASFMRRLYRQFLTTTSGGNVSCRTPDGNIVITASQSDKCEQSAETVGILTPDGFWSSTASWDAGKEVKWRGTLDEGELGNWEK